MAANFRIACKNSSKAANVQFDKHLDSGVHEYMWCNRYMDSSSPLYYINYMSESRLYTCSSMDGSHVHNKSPPRVMFVQILYKLCNSLPIEYVQLLTAVATQRS